MDQSETFVSFCLHRTQFLFPSSLSATDGDISDCNRAGISSRLFSWPCLLVSFCLCSFLFVSALLVSFCSPLFSFCLCSALLVVVGKSFPVVSSRLISCLLFSSLLFLTSSLVFSRLVSSLCFFSQRSVTMSKLRAVPTNIWRRSNFLSSTATI